MSNTSNSNQGIVFLMILFLIFLVLKLTNNIDWSWWWVTSPLWISLVVFFGFLTLCGTFVFLVCVFGAFFGAKTNRRVTIRRR